MVRVYFSLENLNDPSLFNEQALEDSELGSLVNYRGKINKAIAKYLGVSQKWSSLRIGAMAQRLPSYIPARDYVSSSRADSLKLPYTRKEALIKFQVLEQKIEKASGKDF